MEPLNLPVRLRPVGPSPLGLDPELGAGITPGMRAVGRAVVREHPLHLHAQAREVGDRAAQHRDGRLAAFIAVPLDMGEARVIIDHGVQKAHPEPGLVWGITGSFAVRGRRAVLQALLAPDESVSAPSGMRPNVVTSTWISEPGWGCS